jgi:hypothetical protein
MLKSTYLFSLVNLNYMTYGTWLTHAHRCKILNLAGAALGQYTRPALDMHGLRQTRYTIARSSTAGQLKRLILQNLLVDADTGSLLRI